MREITFKKTEYKTAVYAKTGECVSVLSRDMDTNYFKIKTIAGEIMDVPMSQLSRLVY